MRCLIVSGQSGSGKSVALHTLEDAGYYCIDNLPVELLPDLIEKLASRPIQSKIAVGVDARSSDEEGMKALPAILQQLRDNGIKVEVLFFTDRSRHTGAPLQRDTPPPPADHR
ncbi:nucleotide-binding protein Hhal_2130-like [Oratosquilla oratoria]|uniref:nucleotide-binding protein Hhal_2130-like n=1 Tax=Oratosquilla oratoria TaxID=337810 RepID=UPI003F75EB10